MPSQLPELPLEALSQRFKQFAFHVSQQASPLYAQLSVAVADDPELLMLASHAGRGQPAPNLFFAAIHFLLLKGVQHSLSTFYPSISAFTEHNANPYPTFRSFCLDHREEIRQLLATRLVQTNEIGRCAYRCKHARSDLFTSEELQFKKDVILTEEEAKKTFPASASNNKEARQWYRISVSFSYAPKTRNDPGDFWEPLFTVKALKCMISQELMTHIL